MPRQKGTHKLTGTIGDLTYYESPYGYLVRRTARHNPDRIRTDPAFERTRNNAHEFGQVAKTAGQLRRLMGNMFQDCGDMTMTSRLMSVLHKVMKEDNVHAKGERTVLGGLQQPAGQALLTGFELNAGKPLYTFYEGTLKVDTQTGIILMPMDKSYFKCPPTATHVCFTSDWMRLDPNVKKGHAIITKIEPQRIDEFPNTLEIKPVESLPGEALSILMLHLQFFRKNGEILDALQENRCGQIVGVG